MMVSEVARGDQMRIVQTVISSFVFCIEKKPLSLNSSIKTKFSQQMIFGGDYYVYSTAMGTCLLIDPGR